MKNLIFTIGHKIEILRLKPQNDIVSHSECVPGRNSHRKVMMRFSQLAEESKLILYDKVQF